MNVKIQNEDIHMNGIHDLDIELKGNFHTRNPRFTISHLDNLK